MSGGFEDHDRGAFVLADETARTAAEAPLPIQNDDENVPARKIAPDQFSEVDKLTNLTIFTLVVCVLGVVGLLGLIVVGARRIRTMTRSPLLKSKYDELELLRERYRREVDGLDPPTPPGRENRR